MISGADFCSATPSREIAANDTFFLPSQQQAKFHKSRFIETRGESIVQEYDPRCEVLFQRLRELRKEIATAENLPPYVVFSDKSLREMSLQFPKDHNAFLLISGVGRRKLESYGDAFLAAINEFCRDGE